MEEKVPTELKNSELKQELARKTMNELQEKASSVLLLCLQWKELEDHFDSIRGSIQAEKEEVERKEKVVRERERGVGVKEKRVEELVNEVKLKDQDFKEWRRELELKEINFGQKVRERYDEIELKEKKVEEEFREVALRKERVEKRFKEVEEERRVGELFKEVKWKGREVEERLKEVGLKDRKVEERLKEVGLKDRKVEERLKEVELMEKNVGKKNEEVELNRRKLEERIRELELKSREVVEIIIGVELKEKELEERCRGVDVKGKQIEEVQLREKKLEERLREVELENKKCLERIKDFELKEKQLFDASNARVKSETVDCCLDANLHFSVKMDGKALQIFLNKGCKDDEKMKNEVSIALRLSSDPAKLVLDAMEGFYPPHLREGDVEFKEVVVKRSCNLLLEQLMKISPTIKPHVRKEATKLAFLWMTKMTVDNHHCLDVLGFFYLLASYGLASAFDSDELISRLVIIAGNRQTPEFLRVLELGDKIPGFIQNLILKKQPMEATRFIFAFEMVNRFPPETILRDYLTGSKIAARKIRRRSNSFEGLVESVNRRVADLMAVLKCVEEYKLETVFSPNTLKQQIKDVERQLSIRKTKLPDLDSKSPQPNLREKNRLAPKSAASAPVLPSKSVSATKPALNSTMVVACTATSTNPITVPSPPPTAASIASPFTVTSLGPITASIANPVAPIDVTSPSTTAAAATSPIAVTSPSITASTTGSRVAPPSSTSVSIRKTKLPDLDSKSPQPNLREKNRLAPKSAASATVLPSKSVSATKPALNSTMSPLLAQLLPLLLIQLPPSMFTSPSTTAAAATSPIAVTSPSITASTTGSRVAPPSSTSASPSASVPKTEPVCQGGNKRRQAQYQGSDKHPQEQHQGCGQQPAVVHEPLTVVNNQQRNSRSLKRTSHLQRRLLSSLPSTPVSCATVSPPTSMEEKICRALKLTKLRQESFSRSLDEIHEQASSILALQRKNIETHFDSTFISIEDSAKELQTKERRLEEREKEIDSKEKEFEERCEEFIKLRDAEVEEHYREIELKEKDFEDRRREVELERKKLEGRRKEVEEEEELVRKKFAYEIELKEKEIEERRRELEVERKKLVEKIKLKEEKIEERRKEIEVERKKLIEGIESKEKKIEERQKEIEVERKKLDEEVEDRALEVEFERKRNVECLEELKLKQKEVELKEKHLEEQLKEVVLANKRFFKQDKELELKEKQLLEGFKEREMGILVKLKEEESKEWRRELGLKQINFRQKVRERYDEFELKEKKFEEEFREVALREERVEKRFREVEEKERRVGELFKEAKVKDDEFREWRKGVELKEKELQWKGREVEERLKEVELMEKNVGKRSEEVELNRSKLEEGFRELELKSREVEEIITGAELKEKELEERCRGVDLKGKQIEEVQLREKKLEERLREVELKNKKCLERIKDFELKEKQLFDASNARVKSETVDCSLDANLHFSVKMDGKALQIFLNKGCKDDEKMKNEVSIALRLSSDPAKLVLDAMEGFYPPHLREGDVEFKEVVVKRNCNLLLEQLMKISPTIKPHVRKEATKLAFLWMTKMTVDNQHCLDVLGFFFLLASYGLASAFDSDELISRLVIIARNRQTPEFLRVLELGDKIPGFIQNLILKKQPMEAIRFIFAFEMVYRFPPEAILRDYLTCSQIAARKIRWSSNSIEGLVESLNRRVSDLVAVLKCVEDYKLESIFSPNTLKQQIKDVERQLSMRQTKLPDLDSKSPQPNLREKNRLAPKSAASAPVLPSKSVSATPSITASTTGSRVAPPSSTSAPPSASVPKTDPPYQGGNKRRQARYQGSDKPPREQHQGGNKRPRIQRLP
ncbi:FRIGIDA-LIKE PROTEIN [Salix purpurea]|uniref:FRIGIDA-LIKE PROTEIN n=1 Tax=Salix purpurea TaxID=77065 RepID=A0A9Q0WZH7_SALPP|nr:FRIGIDA-LIKE PROTEIN [Salix purpurea]